MNEIENAKGAVKFDGGKARYDLLPPDALEILAQIYTMGACKYADHNWAKGANWSRWFAAAMRHAWAFWRGEDLDPESGLPHVAHAAWNLIALLCHQHRGIGTDDRFKGKIPPVKPLDMRPILDRLNKAKAEREKKAKEDDLPQAA